MKTIFGKMVFPIFGMDAAGRQELMRRCGVRLAEGRMVAEGAPEAVLSDDVARNLGVALEHACGGNCACTTCHVIIREGARNLSEMEDDEADRLDMAADLQLNSRLGCQATITGPGEVVVEIPAWNRNYVSEGSH